MTDESDSTVGSTVPQPDGQPDRPPLGSLVPAKNGGQIRYGNAKGVYTGGPGRPKDQVRRMLRDWAYERFDDTPELAAKWADLKPDEKIRALDMALKYGVGTQTETVTPEDVAATAQRMLAVLVDDLTARGWPLPDVQALATKMANAAKGDDAAGA